MYLGPASTLPIFRSHLNTHEDKQRGAKSEQRAAPLLFPPPPCDLHTAVFNPLLLLSLSLHPLSRLSTWPRLESSCALALPLRPRYAIGGEEGNEKGQLSINSGADNNVVNACERLSWWTIEWVHLNR